MLDYLLMSLLLTLGSTAPTTETGHHITVSLQGIAADQELILGYYKGEGQFVQDTLTKLGDGTYELKGEEPLPGGLYFLLASPSNDFIGQVLIDRDQTFGLATSMADATEQMKVTGSELNAAYFDYLRYLSKRRTMREQLTAQAESPQRDERLAMLDNEVKAEQRRLIDKYPDSMLSLLMMANSEFPLPEHLKAEDADPTEKFYYMRDHYFDVMPLGDERIFRTNYAVTILDNYLDRYTAQHPDSLARSLDRILDGMPEGSEMQQYYLIRYVNKYAKSNVVGMDALYVHLGKTYNAQLADILDEEQMAKLDDRVKVLEPILLGKKAPNIVLQTQDKKLLDLHEFDSKYTVLFFWDPDCGHCKKSLPDVKAFYEKYKPQGVELIAVCTKLYKDGQKCWDTIEEREMTQWINAWDPYLRSRYKQLYDVRTTPQIFILDADKKILSKRIGGSQLDEVMQNIMKIDANKAESAAGK